MTKRIKSEIEEIIKRQVINLSNLTILTEAASGAYLYTPIMAALAGAKKVVAIAADSRYGKADEIIEQTKEVSTRLGVGDKIFFEKDKSIIDYSEIDMITNSGFVRPINMNIIRKLKKTAVIPLMWETWEYRGDEVDLKACKAHDILMLGTDESHSTLDIEPYVGMLLLKLLFELGLSGYKSKIILIASNKFGDRLKEACVDYGIKYAWFSDSKTEALPLSELSSFVESNIELFDAIILGELKDDRCLIGRSGLLQGKSLLQKNPDIKIGIIAGNVDVDDLISSKIHYVPKEIAPPKYVTYQIYQLGKLPILELYGAGLKVGQAMAWARINGMDIQESVKYSLKNSAAMDFVGGLSWL